MRTYRTWLMAIGLLVCMNGCKKQESPKDDGHDHSAHASEPKESAIGPESSAVPVDLSKGWCAGHGVPESVCSRCDETLVARFKAANDWCSSHNLPESQCVKCHPEVEAKWEALKPKDASTKDEHSAAQSQPTSANGLRPLTGQNDPLCEVDKTPIHFTDPTVAAKAGIAIEQAQRRRMSATIDVPAEVEYDARKLVRVTPRVPGIIVTASADLGDSVKAGDVLAVIESAELGEAKSHYLELRENLAISQADFERAEAIYQGTQRLLSNNPTTWPADADAIAGEAKGRLINAQAQLTLSKAAFDRSASLKTSGVVSQEAFESASASLQKAETEYAVARDALSYETKRTRLAAEKSVRIARNSSDVAARKLHLLGITVADIAAMGNTSQDTLSRYELRSPVAGRVIDRRAAMGESVDVRKPLYAVVDLDTLWLELNVPLRDAALLSPGQSVLFTADGLPGESFQGQLTWISSEVDDRARTLKVRAVLPNKNGRVRAKMFGIARIALHENSDVLSVPQKAVQTDGCCQLVFIRKSNQLFEPRKVTLGASANNYVEILNGLAAGDPVVTTGSFLMKTEILKSSIGAGCCEVDAGR